MICGLCFTFWWSLQRDFFRGEGSKTRFFFFFDLSKSHKHICEKNLSFTSVKSSSKNIYDYNNNKNNLLFFLFFLFFFSGSSGRDEDEDGSSRASSRSSSRIRTVSE